MSLNDKKEIRKYILEKRDKVDIKTRADWDKIIFNKLINSDFYKNAKYIFTFISFGSEVDTHEIIKHALGESKIIYVPKINSKEKIMEIFKITSLDELEIGYFGILEPKAGIEEADKGQIDLILMPGVAFDRQGGRVGYGKGFYDNFLRKLNRKVDKIALSYDFQVLESVPMDEFDFRIDGIITNEQIIQRES